MRCRRAVLPLSAAKAPGCAATKSMWRRKSNIETAAAACGRYCKSDPSGRDGRLDDGAVVRVGVLVVAGAQAPDQRDETRDHRGEGDQQGGVGAQRQQFGPQEEEQADGDAEDAEDRVP